MYQMQQLLLKKCFYVSIVCKIGPQEVLDIHVLKDQSP